MSRILAGLVVVSALLGGAAQAGDYEKGYEDYIRGQLEAALAKKLTPKEIAEAATRAERCLASDYRDYEYPSRGRLGRCF